MALKERLLLGGIVLLFLVSSPLHAQKKFDKLLRKADIKYEYGDYKKATKGLA